MPLYNFKCNICGHKFETILPMSQRHDIQQCPMCLKGASRDAETELRGMDSTVTEDHKRWSWSMGCATPAEGREVLKANPNVEFKFGDHGPILVKNRKHKKEMMKIRNMVEYQ
jgi:putative FmdB family regulatory protein